MTDELTALVPLILHMEGLAIIKAMCGRWTKADDAHLAALYVERRRLYEKGTGHE